MYRSRRHDGVAEPEGHRADGQAEGVGGDLGHGGVGAWAHVTGRRFDQCAAVGVQPYPGLGRGAEGVVDGGRHAGADQPVAVVGLTGFGVAAAPAELASAGVQAFAQPHGRRIATTDRALNLDAHRAKGPFW